MPVSTRNILIHQSQTQRHIDGEEPDIARDAVKDTPHKRFLTRQAGHLTICRVAEIG